MDSTLQQGIAAAKSGDKARAFDLLTRAAQDPSASEQAWLWLSSVVDSDSEKLYCLNYALNINPGNAAAQRAADSLRRQSVLPAVPVYPTPSQTVAPAMASMFAPAAASPSMSSPGSVQVSKMNFQQAMAAPTQGPMPVTASTPAGPTPDKQAMQGLVRYAAAQLAKNSPPELVERLLVGQGTSPQLAHRIVAETNQALKKARRARGKRMMTSGALWAAGGIIVTIGTFAFAAQLGGSYVVAWGAIAYGFINFIRGFVSWIGER